MANWQRIDIYIAYPSELEQNEALQQVRDEMGRYGVGSYSIIPIAGAWDGVPEGSFLIRRFTDSYESERKSLLEAVQSLVWKWHQDAALVNVESANVDFILNFQKGTY